MDGVTCLGTCPARSSSQSGQCACQTTYEPSPNKDACICPYGDLVDLDGVSCVAICSAGGADDNYDGICECTNGKSGVNCDVCLEVYGVDLTTCMTSCPDFSTADGAGVCYCDGALTANGNTCDCGGGLLVDIDGLSCVVGCSYGSDVNPLHVPNSREKAIPNMGFYTLNFKVFFQKCCPMF